MGRRRQRGEARQAMVASDSADLSLVGLPPFSALVPSERQRQAFLDTSRELIAAGGALAGELALGCVERLDRGFPVVCCEHKVGRCEYGQGLSSLKTDDRAAVGDWVVARWPEGHDMGVLVAVLPRESDVARWRGSSRGERQTLAANVDEVLVAQPLSKRGVLLDRIARSRVIALDCGATASVVLTKADRCPTPKFLVEQLELVCEVVGEGIPIVATSAADVAEIKAYAEAAIAAGFAWGPEEVRRLVPAGTVGIVLGESGAGKSTLLNVLLGGEVLATGAVRERDDAGRQTTVSRRMVEIPGAGVIVDEPGLRSLPLVGHERGLAKAFPEIAEAASTCRFRDCTHTGEPGCGVQEAFRTGAFPKARLDAYLALAAEMRASSTQLDPDVVI